MIDTPPPYQTLKLATRLFGKAPEALDSAQRQQVVRAARHQCELEALVLASPEASGVVLPQTVIAAAVGEIRGRFTSDEEFRADLARCGLDAAALHHAVARDLTVEAVLEKVGARATAVSDTDVEIFWFMHRERFRRPETRSLRHILVTINDSQPGSERDAARAKITAIEARLRKAPERFAEQALKHSECPTAMDGGRLGTLPRGKLYPELDAAAFALPAGGLSGSVESELGYHLILCESIAPEHLANPGEAGERIRQHLENQRRTMCQKSWINSLRLAAASGRE